MALQLPAVAEQRGSHVENSQNSPGPQSSEELPEKQPHGRRKTRQEGRISPFGEVLVDFMSRQRPIWTTGKMAHALRTRRQTVGNWVYHDITPPVETMLEILAKLGIPLSEVLAAYQRRGVAIPMLTAPGAASETPVVASTPGVTGQTEREHQQATQERERQRQREWDEMIAQTKKVMLATGFPEQALDALLAGIEAKRDGGSAIAPFITSEHAPIRASQEPEEPEEPEEPRRIERTRQGK